MDGLPAMGSHFARYGRWGDEMDYNVTEARYVAGYVVWLRFRDGTTGEVDLARELYGTVFEPLKDVAYFRQVRLDPDSRTIVWPNGADIAPEYLHELVRVADWARDMESAHHA